MEIIDGHLYRTRRIVRNRTRSIGAGVLVQAAGRDTVDAKLYYFQLLKPQPTATHPARNHIRIREENLNWLLEEVA